MYTHDNGNQLPPVRLPAIKNKRLRTTILNWKKHILKKTTKSEIDYTYELLKQGVAQSNRTAHLYQPQRK